MTTHYTPLDAPVAVRDAKGRCHTPECAAPSGWLVTTDKHGVAHLDGRDNGMWCWGCACKIVSSSANQPRQLVMTL